MYAVDVIRCHELLLITLICKLLNDRFAIITLLIFEASLPGPEPCILLAPNEYLLNECGINVKVYK